MSFIEHKYPLIKKYSGFKEKELDLNFIQHKEAPPNPYVIVETYTSVRQKIKFYNKKKSLRLSTRCLKIVGKNPTISISTEKNISDIAKIQQQQIKNQINGNKSTCSRNLNMANKTDLYPIKCRAEF